MHVFSKIQSKMKRLMGHNSFRDLCSYCSSVRNKPDEKDEKKRNVTVDAEGEKRGMSVIWYGGNLNQNGMTTSLVNLIAHLPSDTYCHTIFYDAAKVTESRRMQQLFPQGTKFMAFYGIRTLPSEIISRILYYVLHIRTKKVQQKMDRMFTRNAEEYFGQKKNSCLIQFTGYDRDVIGLFANASADRGRMIFVHNDKAAETSAKNGEDGRFLREYMPRFDKVLPVTEDILESIYLLHVPTEKCAVINNYHDDVRVKAKSREPVRYQEVTRATHTAEELMRILENAEDKFITIGRYVPQKGHGMLLEAFAAYLEQNTEAWLIIIGGYGTLYEATLQKARQLGIAERVVLIEHMENPMPVLARCQLFILSSLYEGQGLVLLEADSLHIPVISTDIPGPRGFMKRYNGFLVRPDKNGILEGMLAYKKGLVHTIDIDYTAYNRQCIAAMTAVLDNGYGRRV